MSALTYSSLDSAIAQFEGFGKPGTIATITNNPGDIISGPFASARGAVGSYQGTAIFPTATQGTAAEDALVSQYANNGATIEDLINGWAPPTAPGNSPASTQNYLNFVTSKLGVTPQTPVSSLASNVGSTNQTESSPSTPSTPSTSSGINWGNILGGIAGTAVQGALGINPSTDSTLSWGRIGAFLLGLILIAGGIYLFKPVQENVNAAVRTGARTAALVP